MKNKFVDTLLFLEEFQLKESHDKQAFFMNLKDKLDIFPNDVAKNKILPKLIHVSSHTRKNPFNCCADVRVWRRGSAHFGANVQIGQIVGRGGVSISYCSMLGEVVRFDGPKHARQTFGANRRVCAAFESERRQR